MAQLTNANHDGVTQQIADRLQGFETENMMLLQAVSGVHTARQGGSRGISGRTPSPSRTVQG